jgi:hypothetical protein
VFKNHYFNTLAQTNDVYHKGFFSIFHTMILNRLTIYPYLMKEGQEMITNCTFPLPNLQPIDKCSQNWLSKLYMLLLKKKSNRVRQKANTGVPRYSR